MDKIGLNFGQLIAYLIPGFLGTYALADHVGTIKELLGGPERVPTTGSIAPLLLIALAVGIVLNAFSSVVIRPLIHVSGVKHAKGIVYRKFSSEDMAKYQLSLESTFMYHKFYSNTLVAILLLTRLWFAPPFPERGFRIAAFLVVTSVLFSAARSSLRSFYVSMSGFIEHAE
jgi:ethanolamine transporter EutH